MKAAVIDINQAPALELEIKALTLPEQAKAITIRDQGTYDLAAVKLKDVVAMRKEIVDYHKPLKDKAHAAHKAICDAEKKMLDPISEAERILKTGIGAWESEQRRIEDARRREAEEAARKAQEEALEASIEQAEAEGAAPEEIEAMVAQPVAVPRIEVQSNFQRAAGVTTAKIYKAEVIDIRKLARAVADGVVSPNLVTANQTALNGLARSTKGSMQIPGVRFIEDFNVRAGR